MKSLRLIPLLSAWLVGFCGAATHAATPSAPALFEDGDRWVAVGDSITHNGSYHRFVYLYYATRFPDRKIDFFNAGYSGDTAALVLRRFDTDLLPHHANVATVMLGMNDVGRSLYEAKAVGPEVEAKRRGRIAAYGRQLREIVERLKSSGHRVVLITPSPYDQTVQLPTPGAMGCNDALALCADEVRAVAAATGSAVVDFHGPLTALNLELQRKDPALSLIGRDRIHPGDPGHWAMAYHFLRAQGAPAIVTSINIDAAARRVVESERAAVTELQATPDHVTFRVAARALPMPRPDSVGPTQAWVPWAQDLNREPLTITHLAPGRYALRIDGEAVADFSAEELAAGVNLAEHATPQARQAQAVLALDKQRNDLVRRLRVIPLVEISLGRFAPPRSPLDGFDYRTPVEAYLARNPRRDWGSDQRRLYFEVRPRETELWTELEQIVAQMRAAALPPPRHYDIARLP